MSNHKPKSEPICYCTGTTKQQIEQLLAEQVDTLEKIAYATGATTGCAACEYDILELIKQHKPS